MVLILCLGLTSCYLDPYANPRNWSMTGAVHRNIAVQADYPSDLISGRSDPTSDGVAATAAIDKGLSSAPGVLPPPPPAALNITGS